jgi:hypothetical protein
VEAPFLTQHRQLHHVKVILLHTSGDLSAGVVELQRELEGIHVRRWGSQVHWWKKKHLKSQYSSTFNK